MSLTLKDVTAENADVTLPQVLELVHALATFEKAPDAVEATVPLLKESFGFGDQRGERYTRAVLAYKDGESEPVGMAVYCEFRLHSSAEDGILALLYRNRKATSAWSSFGVFEASD